MGVWTISRYAQAILLTGQRRDKVASIRHDDLKNGAWTIATEAREKTMPVF